MRDDWFTKSVFVLTLLFFTGVLLYFLQNDFWQDEVYTLVHFVFVPVHTTLTDYHSTNNHVLFSFVNNAVRYSLGFHHLSDVLRHPYRLRFIPVAFSVLSLVFFYRNTKNAYGKSMALLCSSIWLTTFPMLCFASQFRGYSLSVLIVVLQYFYFLKTIKEDRISVVKWLRLFLYTSFSLLCLPTNIYIEASYLLLCLFLFIQPSSSVLFFNTQIRRNTLSKAATALIAGCLCTGFYYRWMLQRQPSNELITNFHLFQLADLMQGPAIFYHLAGYRFYLCLSVAAILVLYSIQIKKRLFGFRPSLLPLVLFFLPFVFFFVHGAIIIQRTFLSLIPFFVLLTGLSLKELLGKYTFYNRICQSVLVLNFISVMVSFVLFVHDSKNNNRVENHQQDLVQHYYLINFNALQASLLTKDSVDKTKRALYLYDGFGQTGIDYYLTELKVPYHLYSDTIVLPKDCFILTNLKQETGMLLQKKKIAYDKIIGSDYQYNLFVCHETDSSEIQNSKP